MARTAPPDPFRLWRRAAAVWLVLGLALAATVAGAWLDIGIWKLPLAMAIAAIKAALVIVIFMELPGAGAGARIALLAGALWLALLIALTFADVATRAEMQPPHQGTAQ